MKWFRIVDASSIVLSTEPEVVLTSWGNYLANVSRLLVLVQNVETTVRWCRNKFVINDRRYYILTNTLPPFQVINEEPSRLLIEKTKPTYLVLSDGSFAKCLIAYQFQDVEPGFVESRLWHEVMLTFVSASDEQSRLYSMFRHLTKQSVAGTITSHGEIMLENYKMVCEALSKGSRLLRFLIIFIVRAHSLEELKEKEKVLVNEMSSKGVFIEAPPLIQHKLYNMPEILKSSKLPIELPAMYSSSNYLSITYPVTSMELVEDEGVYFGKNIITESPVFINLYKPFHGRTNWHLAVTGVSGAGKTVSASVIIKRMDEAYKPWIFIIDPMSNWVRFAQQLWDNYYIIDFSPSRMGCGLDPVKLARKGVLTFQDVVDFIINLYGIDSKWRGRLLYYASNANNYEDLIGKVFEHELKLYLESLRADNFIYDGELKLDVKRYRHFIFGLREIVNERVKALIMALLSLVIMSLIVKLPGKKLVFIDEFHLVTKYPGTQSLAELLVRMARAMECSIIIATQSIIDFTKTPTGKAILENVSSKFFLKDDPGAVEELKAQGLSEHDIDKYILKASRGCGVLRTGNVKVPVKIELTDEEYEIFRTE